MHVRKEPLQFQWDSGNREKNWLKHRVTPGECEEVFFDPHKRISRSALDTGRETRYALIGRTQAQRWLFVVFTLRGHMVRVISARDLNRRERGLHEETA